MTKSTTIRVSEETKLELKKLGTMDDSYNTVISRLIEEHNNNMKKQANTQ
jgi:predicted CopG family antitoxin